MTNVPPRCKYTEVAEKWRGRCHNYAGRDGYCRLHRQPTAFDPIFDHVLEKAKPKRVDGTQDEFMRLIAQVAFTEGLRAAARFATDLNATAYWYVASRIEGHAATWELER